MWPIYSVEYYRLCGRYGTMTLHFLCYMVAQKEKKHSSFVHFRPENLILARKNTIGVVKEFYLRQLLVDYLLIY